MDHFMEAYLRWLGQASDEELVRRKDEVAVALLQAGIDSTLSRLLSGLLGEEVDAREQVLRMRTKQRSRSVPEVRSRQQPQSQAQPGSKPKPKPKPEPELEARPKVLLGMLSRQE